MEVMVLSLPELLYEENNSLSGLGREAKGEGERRQAERERQYPLTLVLFPKGRGYCLKLLSGNFKTIPPIVEKPN
jgi:hypothetical protein